MIFFVTVLRALAACFITNAHYAGIYPTDLLSSGGVIGDVLFFAVSGYCLCRVKYPLTATGFARWYGRRLWRVYPPVLIMTLVYMLAGAYRLSEHSFAWWYLYPTFYHFVASIIVLYVPFFFIVKIRALRRNIPPLMLLIAVAWLAVYFTAYDRSWYHIDKVREPMIRFLFMESMLLGAWFRGHDKALRNRFRSWYVLAAAAAFFVYFAGKLLIDRRPALSGWQFVNQIVIFALLYFLLRIFCGLDGKLEAMPAPLKRAVNAVSGMTLEIYVVQYVLLDLVRGWGLFFPLNWILATALILCSAAALHRLCGLMYGAVDKALARGGIRR